MLIKFRLTSSMKDFTSSNTLRIPASKSDTIIIFQKLYFRPGNVRCHRKKALFEAWERHITEMTGLGRVCLNTAYHRSQPQITSWTPQMTADHYISSNPNLSPNPNPNPLTTTGTVHLRCSGSDLRWSAVFRQTAWERHSHPV